MRILPHRLYVDSKERFSEGKNREPKKAVTARIVGVTDLEGLMHIRDRRRELFRKMATPIELVHELIENRDPEHLIVAALWRRGSRGNSEPDRLHIDITQEGLALGTALSRETVNLRLAILSRNGFVWVKRGRMNLLDYGMDRGLGAPSP